MKQILVYGDSLSWGIVPGTRRRLPFSQRWPGIVEGDLVRRGLPVRVSVHLDADQHAILGAQLVDPVVRLVRRTTT